jgi:hypothetical protein
MQGVGKGLVFCLPPLRLYSKAGMEEKEGNCLPNLE